MTPCLPIELSFLSSLFGVKHWVVPNHCECFLIPILGHWMLKNTCQQGLAIGNAWFPKGLALASMALPLLSAGGSSMRKSTGYKIVRSSDYLILFEGSAKAMRSKLKELRNAGLHCFIGITQKTVGQFWETKAWTIGKMTCCVNLLPIPYGCGLSGSFSGYP